MDYVVGVDAGGTKIIAQSYNLEGEEIYSAEEGPGNVTVNFQRSINNIRLAVDRVLNAHPEDNCVFICVGCAGVDVGNTRERAARILNSFYGDKLTVTNDARLALCSAMEGEDGALVISGTGSIALMKKDRIIRRCGGWGHLIDDEGSGYAIVMDAMREITMASDCEMDEIPLGKAIFKELNINGIFQMIEFVYKVTKSDIAALFPTVKRVAEEGDETAAAILKKAGRQLADKVCLLCESVQFENPRVAVSGGVIVKSDMVLNSFLQRLDERIKNYRLVDKHFEPAKAALYFYREAQKNGGKSSWM